MSVPPAIAAAVGRAAGRAVTGGHAVAGGDINDAWAVDFEGGERAFVKSRQGAPSGEYTTEAAGLAWLAGAGALRVPRVLAVGEEWGSGPRFLALEWIEAGRLDGAGEEALGHGLAAVHAAGADGFGSPSPLHIGPVVLPGGRRDDWPGFYADCRLRPLLAPAADGGALSAAGVRAIEAVCERLDDLAGPPEPPARLHGDLWAGNVLAGADGGPWLIDPAAYGGHREVDLAMLDLFGGPGPRTLAAYREAAPLAEGYEDRVALWQLFPLLVHTVLFGGSYGAAAERAARRYAG